MADNYLERRMEEYRSGKLTRQGVRRVSAFSLPKDKILVDFPQRTVIVAGNPDVVSEAVVRSFIAAGCKTAFCCEDMRNGQMLAQTTGARFYRLGLTSDHGLMDIMEDVTAHWNAPDTLVAIGSEAMAMLEPDIEAVTAISCSDNGRFIVVTDRSMPPVNFSSAETITGKCYGIRLSDFDPRSASLASSLCISFCQPCGRFLSGTTVEV